MQQVTKGTTAKRISMIARATLVKTAPNALTELTVMIAAVPQVLTEPTASTILTNVLAQTARTTLPAWIRSMDITASARKDSPGKPVNTTMMNVLPIPAKTKPVAWIW